MVKVRKQQCHSCVCLCAYICHKCKRNKVSYLQAVCPGDKSTGVEKQKHEKQQGQRSSKSIQQPQTHKALEKNYIWVVTGGYKEGYR